MLDKIIDFHTHAFPDKLHKAALETLSQNSGGLTPVFDGSLAGLAELMKRSGLTGAVVLNIATNSRQQAAVNDFAIHINSSSGETGIYAFGSVFPEDDPSAALAELNRLHAGGVRGIKLHPDYQCFFVDDPQLRPIYHEVERLGLMIVFHSGMDLGLFEPVHCTPERLASILPIFKKAPIVAAHLGGYMQWYEVEKHLVGKKVFLDTSYLSGRIPPMHAKRIIEAHGSEKILFGSDAPWSEPISEANLLRSLAFTETDLDNIFYKNAEALLEL